jgi:hypothetical protein
MKRTPATIESAIGRLILTAIPVFWGLALAGVALWLSAHRSRSGTVTCLLLGAGYFWFAWSLYWDPNVHGVRGADVDDGTVSGR